MHVESEPFACVGGAELAGLHPVRLPAALAGLGQEVTDPAAQVQQPPAARCVALDPLWRATRGLPLPSLLLDVVIGGSLRVRSVHQRPGRHRIQLHVPAVRAADDVRQRGAEPIGAGNQATAAISPATAR